MAHPVVAAPTHPVHEKEETPVWKTTLEVVVQIVLAALIPLAVTLLLYFTVPATISAIVLPIAAISTVFTVAFLFPRTLGSVFIAKPLPVTAPYGLVNGGKNNCWACSLSQNIRKDAGMVQWFTDLPNEIADHELAFFQRFDLAVLQNLLAQDVDLPDALFDGLNQEGRAEVLAFVNTIRGKTEEEKQKLFRAIRFIQATQYDDTRNALIVFRDLLTAPKDENNRTLQFDTGRIRQALHALNPDIKLGNTQLDPMEALTIITGYLLPADLQATVRTTRHYEGGHVRAMDVTDPFIPLQITGDNPNFADLLRTYENRADAGIQVNIEGILRQQIREETKFVKAPPSLWVQLKRFRYVEGSPWACLSRLLPTWFTGVAEGMRKVMTSVQGVDTIDIAPIEGDPARYKLDGFIWHKGLSATSGHYIAYTLEEDGNWYEMNDSQVRLVSPEEISERQKEAYALHYSKNLSK